MAGRKFDVEVDFSENQLKGTVLEKFDNITLPSIAVEGRYGYHIIKKLPVFHNGFGFEFLVTEGYVNSLLGGLAWKDDVVVASGTDVVLSTLVDGVTIDSEVLSTGDRVLLFGQTDQRENGVWVVGDDSPERPFDLDESSDFNNAVVPVKNGLTYKGWQFRCKTIDPDVGIDSIEFDDMTPSVPDSTESVKGKIRIATVPAVVAGSEADTAVTPASLKSVLDPIRSQLSILAPQPPAGLSGKTLEMFLYSALESSTGVTHICTDDLTPDGSVHDFFDGDSGVLSVEIDGVLSGSRVLSTASDVGTYGSLHITDDSDPIPLGELGHGLYKQLSAFVRSELDLSYGLHTYRMGHSTTGDSALLSFYVDNPVSVTVSGVSLILPVTTERYVSGVPSLSVGDSLNVSFSVNNAVGKHYHPSRMARLQGVQTQSIDIAPPVTPPNENESVGFSSKIVQALNGSYSENVEIDIFGYNSKGVAGSPYELLTGSRIDTMSVENRKEAGSGLFPASGYGGTYDSTMSLKTYYTEELQLVNGKYQYPSADYSVNLPVAGPDYSAGMGSATRWVLFDLGIDLDNASSFVLTLPSVEGDWTGVETEGLFVQVKVEGATGWLDANKAFSLVGAPLNDGDACMVYSDSSPSVKRVSFGNSPKTGILLVRVGLPEGSNKKFGQNVTVSNIN